MALNLIEGWTYPIDYRLEEDGVSCDLSGSTVTIALFDRYGTATTSTGEVLVISATCGNVRFVPGTTADFVMTLQPYHMRFKVVTTLGKILYFPNAAQPEKWTVSQ